MMLSLHIPSNRCIHVERVCEVYSVPVPESMEELEYEKRADSIRVANMKRINEKSN